MTMGWDGGPLHEGYAARRLPSGEQTSTWSAETAEFEAYVAVCQCGWRGGEQPPTDAGAEASYEDWSTHHYRPMVTPPTSTTLQEGRDGGGPRHFLDGSAVHAGTGLELLLTDGRWLPVGYEWSFIPGRWPTAHVAIGGPWEAIRQSGPVVSMELPPDAVLRWPEGHRIAHRGGGWTRPQT
jgi:hypothetical protein